MGYREVSVYEVFEVLRLWLLGHGYRGIERLGPVDRKTVRRYVEAAKKAGLQRDAGPDQINDALVGQVVEAVRPNRPDGKGATWAFLSSEQKFLEEKVKKKLKITKIHDLLTRKTGRLVPYATLRRFLIAEFGYGGKQSTVPIADCDPGEELQVDFGRMGLLFDSKTKRRRVAWALIFTPVYSRYTFVFVTFQQTLEATIDAFEAAWEFYGGVFKVVIPDNLKAIIDKADAVNPKINSAFLEYAQSRGFVIDAARVRHPQDKARVERAVPFVRDSFFKGEEFIDLADAQRRATMWCQGRAGMRIHGTTQRRPKEVFDLEEKPLLLAAPRDVYDLPKYAKPKVHPDHHVEVDKALYSVPGDLIGCYVDARADRSLVKIFYRGQLIKTHPKMPPGRRSTDPVDLPSQRTAYAMRDIDHLRRLARSHGESVSAFAQALLEGPLPWTKMRQVYRLLGLVRRFDKDKVDAACRSALEFEAIDVNLIVRIVEKALESKPPPVAASMGANVIPLRFAREEEEFRVSQSINGGDEGD